MSSRRDQLLQLMGITQYTLRHPRALQGEMAISLSPATRLLIVADVPPALSDPLIGDVLRALAMPETAVLTITVQQLTMLPENITCACWLLGAETPLTINGPQLKTPSLETLAHDASARRALWQQICEHEVDLFTHDQ